MKLRMLSPLPKKRSRRCNIEGFVMKPYLSVIIPYFNAPEKLTRLLETIGKSKKAPLYEVIVVNDGSFLPIAIHNLHISGALKKNIRVVHLKTNKGPAVARNKGAAVARGEFLVFLDGDVEVFPDTLSEIAKIFIDDPDVVALTGVWVKEQKSKEFFPNFKALRDWSYWINERDKSGYYFLFSTRIAAIKKAVFDRLGGFDQAYPAPLVEDIELTYRIARRYAIIFAPKVRVRHEFEGFFPIAKKYFLRAYYWTKLYARRKRFDPVATTLQEALTTLSGVGVLAFGSVSVVAIISTLGQFTLPVQIVGSLFIAILVLHLFLTSKFLLFVYHERGLVFALRSFVTGLVLYCFIFAGAFLGRIIHGRS